MFYHSLGIDPYFLSSVFHTVKSLQEGCWFESHSQSLYLHVLHDSVVASVHWVGLLPHVKDSLSNLNCADL